MTAAHLDYETLADLAEGLLDEGRTASARAHVSACDLCRARTDELAQVSRMLSESPVPPMPVHLVERLDAALAAEASRTPAGVTHHRPRRRFQLLSAAAAAAVIFGGGVVAVQAMTDDSGSNSDGATAASQPANDPRASSPGTSARSAPLDTKPPPSSYRIVSSGTDYSAAQLDQQVTATLRGFTGGNTEKAPTAKLTGCVNTVAKDRSVKLVDSARFKGQPATIIALATNTTGTLDVWVVGPDCSLGKTDMLKRAKVAG